MLNDSELSKLESLISEESKTFENISEDFNKAFNKERYLQISLTLICLIQDNLISLNQKISAFYILNEIKLQDNITFNSLIPTLIEIIQTSQHKAEQKIIYDTLLDQLNYKNITIVTFIEDAKKSASVDISKITKLFQNFAYDLQNNNLVKSGMDKRRPVLFEKKQSQIENIDKENKKNVNFSKITNDDLGLNYSAPNFMMNFPDNNFVLFDEEPYWIIPGLKHDFIWESKDKNV